MRYHIFSFLSLFFFLLVGAIDAAGVDRYVDGTGGRDFTLIGSPNDCTNLGYAPCRTIQHAIGQAGYGDHVKVQYGTYNENISINPTVLGTSTINLLITGGWGSGFSQQNPNWITTINGSQNGSVISVDSNSYLQLWIQYFTLTGGKAERGGAVYVRSQGSGPILTELHLVDNKINGNSARYDGGAIYAINSFSNSSLVINLVGNTITNNSCNWYSTSGPYSDGGAISTRCYDGQLTLRARGNEISDNVASRQGGGVFVYTQNGNAATTATFEKNLISGNSVQRAGGGILVDSLDSGQSTVSLTNNIIANNTASMYGGGAFFNSESGGMEVSLINNTITRNNAGSNGGGFNARSVALTGGTLRVDVKKLHCLG